MSSANTGQTFTARIAYWSAVHPWLIVLASVVVIVLAVLSIAFVGAELRDDDSGLGESGRGTELLIERFNAALPGSYQTVKLDVNKMTRTGGAGHFIYIQFYCLI